MVKGERRYRYVTHAPQILRIKKIPDDCITWFTRAAQMQIQAQRKQNKIRMRI
jgi:hypothetical protein